MLFARCLKITLRFTLFIIHCLDCEENGNEEDGHCGKNDKPLLYKCKHQIADKGHTCNCESIGKLSGNMGNVVALGTCTGHDGGIGNG